MRFLIIDSDYTVFLKWFYAQRPGLENDCYQDQARARAESCFGQADFYCENLRHIGHESWAVYYNNFFLQKAWAVEHGLKINGQPRWQLCLRKGVVPWVSRVVDTWLYEVLAAQIRHYKPDVVVNYDMHISPEFFRTIKSNLRLLVGHHAAPLPAHRNFAVYDLVLSVVDNFVDYFQRHGVRSERLRLGFEPRVLKKIGQPRRTIPVLFAGSLHPAHASRRAWLEHICQSVAIEVRTPLPTALPPESPICSYLGDAVWGMDMYQTLYESRLTLNHHIDVAENYAGNLRLFEATGVGTLLITDWKSNLHEIFDPGTELVAYRTPEECVELIRYYLEHEDERQAIARAGQRRTLRDHTYDQRMQELVNLVQQYL